MTIKIGITGGIGSGKSIVSELLKIMGIPVYNSDTEAKKITVTDPYIRQKLIAILGKDIYIKNELNKKLLANYLFSSPVHAQRINNIIHPQVKKHFRKWAENHSSHPVIAMESAILIEAGFANEVDKTIMVYAPEEIRIARVMQRDSISKEAVLQRIASQMSDEEKIKQADYVILNDNKTPLIPQVLKLIEEVC